MSTSRDVSDPRETPTAPAPKRGKREPRPARTRGVEELRIGGDPRVDLLPPEVRSSRRYARTRRGFTWGVLVVVLVVVLANGAAFAYNLSSQAQLLSAQARTSELLAEQQKYVGVRQVQNQVDVLIAGQQVGASTEVDWKKFIEAVGAAEPPTLKMVTMSVDSASPIADYPQSNDPLQGPRIATVEIQAFSATFPDVPSWARAVLAVDGVVDAVPGTVNLDEQSRGYVTTLTIHVSDSLYLKRFETKGK
jgi:hypothetical protein